MIHTFLEDAIGLREESTFVAHDHDAWVVSVVQDPARWIVVDTVEHIEYRKRIILEHHQFRGSVSQGLIPPAATVDIDS